jgi:hypothetical protein
MLQSSRNNRNPLTPIRENQDPLPGSATALGKKHGGPLKKHVRRLEKHSRRLKKHGRPLKKPRSRRLFGVLRLQLRKAARAKAVDWTIKLLRRATMGPKREV